MYIKTPVIKKDTSVPGRSLSFKLEALQPSGSFKIRGISHACQKYISKGAKRFIASSAGNSGLAVAFVGRELSVPVTIVVPELTSSEIIKRIKEQNATVEVVGSSWQEANQHALEMLQKDDALIHPFDDPLLWQGHSTIIQELVMEIDKPDAIVLSVGGGGLLCGVVEGLHKFGWNNVPVIAAETFGTSSYALSTAAGKVVDVSSLSGIATSLAVKRVSNSAVQWAKKHIIKSVLVSDEDAVDACLKFYNENNILVEPACGAALAVAFGENPVLLDYSSLLVIVCGGSCVSYGDLLAFKEKF